MITATETRKKARESLSGRWGNALLITFCFFLLEFLIGLISGIFENNQTLSLLFSLANTIISVPLAYGLWNSFMKFKRGENVKAFEFISFGFSNFSRSWKIAFRIFIKMLAPIILTIISLILLMGGLSFVGISSVGLYSSTINDINLQSRSMLSSSTDLTKVGSNPTNFTTSSSLDVDNSALNTLSGMGIAFLFIGLIAFIPCSIYTFVKSLYYVLSNFIAIDNPDMNAKEVVEQSKTLMTHNKGNYFVLTLSFIGWSILAAFTFGIGYLWLIPYMYISLICFYDELANVNIEKKEVENEVINTVE